MKYKRPKNPSSGVNRNRFRTPRGVPPPREPRKRMMSQARKGHFLHDAQTVLGRGNGNLDDAHHRAFLEGVFARGSRKSTEDAREFIDEKVAEDLISNEEAEGLARLVDKYSFFR